MHCLLPGSINISPVTSWCPSNKYAYNGSSVLLIDGSKSYINRSEPALYTTVASDRHKSVSVPHDA